MIIIEPYPERIDEAEMNAFAQAAGFEWEYLPACFWHEECNAILWRLVDPLRFTFWLAGEAHRRWWEPDEEITQDELHHDAKIQRRRVSLWTAPGYRFKQAELRLLNRLHT